MKLKLVFFISFVVFSLAFIRYSFSVTYSDFTNPNTCSAFWGGTGNTTYCNLTLNDASMGCDGTQSGSGEHVEEVYINASAFHSNGPINVTCQFYEKNENVSSNPTYEYLFYYNSTNWTNITNFSSPDCGTGLGYCNATRSINRSIAFNVNNSEGTHAIRCAIGYNKQQSNYCISGVGTYDVDGINFTVLIPLNYTYWNITFSNGTVISDGVNLTRSDSVIAAANWSKNLSSALVRHNGTGTLLNYTINSSFPGNWTNYTLNFSNAIEFKTGLINISYIWANDSFNLDNSTSPSHYFYLWGYSKVSEISLNQTTLYNSTPVRAICNVIDNITDQGINNSNVSFYGNDNFLNWSLTNSSGYANLSLVVNATSLPSNYSVKCNITDQPSLYYNASSQNSNITNITVLNPYEIQIGDFYLHYSGGSKTRVNLYTTPTIYANVSDAWRVSNVIANLSYPGNAIIVNLSMSGNNNSAGWNLWNYTFNNSQYPLNTTGTYTIRIIANNSNGIENVSSFQTFNVSNNYTLDLTSSYSTYMRGENVTVQALDINGELVENVNWTANITKINETYNFISQATTFNYTILLNDTEGNYSIIANATKDNNTGNNTWNFNVSKSFTIIITTDPSSSPGKYAWVTVLATLYNARGDLHTSSINANITCVNTMYSLNFSSGQATYLCRSPDSYSSSFNITVNVSDQYNNTGENYKTLTTESAPSSGGGGGGGGGFVTIKNCSDGTLYNQCSSNRPLFCKNGILLENCSVCKCESGYDCQIDGSCKLSITILENFSFTLNIESIEIERGENSSVIASLSNTGNTPLSLITLAESECCNVSMEENFSLNENEKRDIPILVHVPLFTNVGEHLLKIKIGKELFKKEETIKIIVLENPQHTALIEFGNFLSTLENEIAEYKKAGVDVRNLENAISESRKMILNANNSIEKDDLEVLKDSIKNLKENINSISSSMLLLRTQRILFENKFLIALLVVMIIMTVYLVPEVFIPLYKLEGNIKKFKTEENDLVSSRVQTEKQYFMRKIDENTFSKIMITKQDQILKLKATIEEREKGRKEILLRMHPKEMLKWFGRGIKNLPKNIKNLILRTFERVKLFKKKTKK